MKKLLLWSCLLLLVSFAVMGTSCTEEEAIGSALGGMAFSSIIGIWICVAVVGGLIGLFLFVVWIIALVDCARRQPGEFPPGTGGENAKTMWLIILIATFFVTQLNGVAAIVYYFMVMKKSPLKR
jgi:hypothetical protein